MFTNKLTNIITKALNFLKGLGTIFLYIILSIIGSLLFKDYYNSSNILVANLSHIATYLLILLVLGIIYHKRLINDFKNFKKGYLKIALKYWLIGLACMFITNMIINSFTHNIPVNESANREILTKFPFSSVVTMAILGPIAEEITFRASFKDAFKNWFPFCLTTGLLFGLAHIMDFNLLELLYIIPYGSLGFFFAKAFYDTDNIYSSILIHCIHNSMAILLILL